MMDIIYKRGLHLEAVGEKLSVENQETGLTGFKFPRKTEKISKPPGECEVLFLRKGDKVDQTSGS